MIAEKQGGLGTISDAETYPLPLFQRLTGLSSWALRQAKRNGLPVKTVGRRKYVRGADWNAYLSALEG